MSSKSPAVTEDDLRAIGDAFTPLSRPPLEVVHAINGEEPRGCTVSVFEAVAKTCSQVGKDGTNRGTTMGVPIVDRATRGIAPGELAIALGRTACLKTMAQDGLVRHLAHEYPLDGCLVVTMEMPRVQRIRRWLRMEFELTTAALDQGLRTRTLDLDRFCRQFQNIFFLDEHGPRRLVRHP